MRALATLGLHDIGVFAITAIGTNAVVGYAGNTLIVIGAAGRIDAPDFMFA
ncbi:hypothetical protein ACFQS7_30480 [Dankookia sp. GCM10030260]|uniref:hypothetical protein n=1 Tax=Dankookia sp. GCM10030260 TaxID=3273390 RepID=UPI00361A78F9